MQQCCILVVDDDPSICELLEVTLQDEGYEVVSHTHSPCAFAELKQRVVEPDLILLDLVMPQLDGFMFRSRLQQDRALASIPVVLLSAASQPVLDAANEAGDTVLAKPFELDTLLATVAAACSDGSAEVTSESL